MRIVRKINLALVAVIGVSAALNFAVLQLTVMPSFLDLEATAAERNQRRVIEAIAAEETQLAHAVRDYAFWDDSYEFAEGRRSGYVAENVNAASLQSLGINYFAVIDAAGRLLVDEGYDFSAGGSRPIRLFGVDQLAADSPFRSVVDSVAASSGVVETDEGLALVAYAPILSSQRTGPSPGVLAFGRLLDMEAIRGRTMVDAALLPVDAATTQAAGVTRKPESVAVRTPLIGLDGEPVAMVLSTIGRTISSAGANAVNTAMALLVAAGALLIVTLAYTLRRIAVRRIETMRAHLVEVASTGNLEPMRDDPHRDELSEMVAAFNRMTVQLGELRESLRRKDYLHGAADQAAGLLHNVRNALNPIGTIAWDLARAEDDPWKQNLAKAIPQLEDETLDPERARKLRSFVALSAGRMLAEGRLRQADLKSLAGMLRHVDAILKDVDRLSRTEHALEPVPLAASVAEVAPLVEKRPGITLTIDLPFGVEPLGHRLTLDQILANLLLNAAEAIEAGEGRGTISITARELSRGNGSALDITVRDDGQGIAPEALEMIFEKGFSTRRERSSGLGLHWCANAANAMGGRLYAESAGLGRGATLHLVLPLASALEEAA